MPPRDASATDRAEKLLESLAAGTDLPQSISRLAAQAQVSYVTMWKAVRRFKESGRLYGRYRVTAERAEIQEPAQSPLARLGQRFTQELVAGRITRGTRLFSIKELTARYGTSTRTLRRILADAVEEGLLVARGRHYTTSIGVPSQDRQRTIVLIAYTQLQGGLSLPPLERDFLRACEMVCVGAQIRLRTISTHRVYDGGVSRMSLDREDIPAGGEVDGYVYMTQSPEAYDEDIMKRLLATRKPVVVFDDGTGVFAHAVGKRAMSRVRVFNASEHVRSGKDTAAYLLAKGHRHVAYISPFHADRWSKVRYEGIRRTIERAGDAFSLTLHAVERSIKDHDYASRGVERCDGSALFRAIDHWTARAPAMIHREAQATRDSFHMGVFMVAEIRAALEPLLQKAASDNRVTAWVMANDFAARIALSYCHEKGIDVPGQLALVSFDDEVESSEREITSYNFNFPAGASAVVQFITSPQAAYWRRRRVIEIGGYMMERRTG